MNPICFQSSCKSTSWIFILAATAALVARGAEKADSPWIELFDGKSLSGWKASERPEVWKVEDGQIVAHGERSHLFYLGSDEKNPAEFQDFHLKAEVLTKPHSNSGIFFCTHFQGEGWPTAGFEAQVNNTHGDPVKTGSLYYIVKNFEAPAKDNEWFTEEVIVQGKHITIKVNDKTIVDYTEPADAKGPHKIDKGTFALQAHDPGSEVHFRSIKVKRL